jgi:hypothetical protein
VIKAWGLTVLVGVCCGLSIGAVIAAFTPHAHIHMLGPKPIVYATSGVRAYPSGGLGRHGSPR